MNELALFAGAGGGILGGKLLGWRTVCAVEREPYAASVLVARQNDGFLPPFPIWDDVRTFDGKPWRGLVDVVSGGFPCQDISAAGKGAGIDGTRSGLWKEMARIVGQVGPRYVFIENSPMLRTRGLHVVLKDLAEMGYDARWGVLGAVDAGAPHKRDRIWIVGNATSRNGERRKLLVRPRQAQPRGTSGSGGTCENVADTGSERGQLSAGRELAAVEKPWIDSASRSSGRIAGEWWSTEPAVGRVANGVAHRVDRLKAIGNGQVPAVAALAWNVLKPIREQLVVHPVP
jgi:DNA (cytosine-5)-methyltransferase 1